MEVVVAKDIGSIGDARSHSWDAVRALWAKAPRLARPSKEMRTLLGDRKAIERLYHDREAERGLVRAFQAGDIGAGLVLWKAFVGIAKRHFPRALLGPGREDEVYDYWQEARLDFLEAVARFDLTKDVRLKTFALPRAIGGMGRTFVTRGEVVHIPVHQRERLGRWRRITHLFSDLEYRASTTGEVDAIAFEETLIEPGEGSDVIVEQEELRARAHKELVNFLLEGVEEKAFHALEGRYLAEDDEEKTLVELGKESGVSREMIRQRQEMALDHMRGKLGRLGAHPENFRSFDEWIAWAYLRLKQSREERDGRVLRAAERALRAREEEERRRVHEDLDRILTSGG